jgi:hypothetical protein
MDQAQSDLGHARNDLAGGYHEWACFSAQQAAEKAVKAVFQALGAVAWGHAVADLLAELGTRHAVPGALSDAAWARGRQTVASDVDLLVVYRGPIQPDAYARVKRAVAIPRLEPHVYSETEYEGVQATLRRMTEGGLVLLDAPAR